MNRIAFLRDPDVVSFSDWLAERLDQPGAFVHSYARRQNGTDWNCDCLYSAYERYWWRGSFDENEVTLDRLSKRLREAVANHDGPAAAQASTSILQWGGVAGNNARWVARHESAMAQILSHDAQLLTAQCPTLRTLTGVNRFNAGFVKIHSLLLDDFIIYDGRVGAALGALVRDWCLACHCTDVPPLLRFPWGAPKQDAAMQKPKNRNPSVASLRFPCLSQRKNFHALCTIRANWLLVAVLTGRTSRFSQCDNPLRALEAALFMIGYDLGYPGGASP